MKPVLNMSRSDNWVKKEAGRPDVVYRFLTQTDTHIHMMEIGKQKKDGSFKLNKPPKTRVLRRVWRKSDFEKWAAANRVLRVEERGIPPRMKAAADAEKEGKTECDEILEMKRDVIAYVAEKYGTNWILSNKSYKEAVNDAMIAFETSKKTIENWLEFDLFYGGHPYANMPHHWLKGAPDEPKPEWRDENGELRLRGRPTDAERIDPDTRYRRRTCSHAMHTRWIEYVRTQARDTVDNLNVILDRFKLVVQVARNRDANGILRTYLAHRKLPRDSYLKQMARPTFRAAQEERKARRSTQPGGRRVLAGGSATLLANGDLNVLDLDATIAENFIRYGDADIYIDGVGKPTVLLAIDRASDCIVGWYVTFGYENGDCYRRCLFSAYTPKERELARWGVPDLLDGMCYGQAAVVFVDRGPGMSEATQMAAVDRLNGDMKFARPGDPQAKGGVEGGMGRFQKALSDLLGSTFTKGDADVDLERRKVAKTQAIPLEVFMVALITWIFTRNTSMNVKHLLTDELLKLPNVKPTPISIYNANKGLRGGDFAEDWPEEKVFRHLNDRHDLLAPNGVVTLDNRQFSSPLLKAAFNVHTAINPKVPFTVTVYSMANAPLELLWDDPAGNLALLEAADQTVANYRDTFKWEHDFVSRLRNAKFTKALADIERAITEAKASADKVISKAQEKVLAEANARRSGKPQASATENRAAAKKKLDRADAQAIVSGFQNPEMSPPATATVGGFPVLFADDGD